MKKKIFILVILLSSVLATTAQGLLGSWQMVVDSPKGKNIYTYVFNQRNRMSYIYSLEQNQEGVISRATVTMPGSFTRAGELLQIEIDKPRFSINIDYIKFVDNRYSDEEKEEIRSTTILGLEYLRQMFVSTMPDVLMSDIKSLSTKELVLVIKGNEQKFKRVASH